MNCPKCISPMVKVTFAGVEVDRCTDCQGLFFDELEKEPLRKLKGAESVMRRVAEPVLTNLATNKLRERMPVEAPRGNASDRRQFSHLEAFGRTLAGIAPWLGLQDKPADEIEPGKRFVELARQGLANATDPHAPDFMNSSIC